MIGEAAHENTATMMRPAMGTAARKWVIEPGSLDVTGPLWAEALGLSVPVERAGVTPD